MRKVHVELEGVAPFLFNGPTGAMTDAPPKNETEEIAQGWRRAYRDDEGIYLPVDNIKKCLFEAATKAKQMGLVKRKNRAAIAPFYRAGLFIDPSRVRFVRKGKVVREPDKELHSKPGRIPPGKGAMVIIRRPILEQWTVAFDFVILDPQMTDEELRAVVETGGRFVGVGGHRPEFGRYEITDFTPLKEKAA